MKADCKFYDITDRLSVYALNPLKCPSSAALNRPDVVKRPTSKITQNVVRSVFNELEKNHIGNTTDHHEGTGDKIPEKHSDPLVPHVPEKQSLGSLGATYTVTRPDYTEECKMVAIQNEVDCFDHYETGYSDAFCQIACEQIQTFRCICHEVIQANQNTSIIVASPCEFKSIQSNEGNPDEKIETSHSLCPEDRIETSRSHNENGIDIITQCQNIPKKNSIRNGFVIFVTLLSDLLNNENHKFCASAFETFKVVYQIIRAACPMQHAVSMTVLFGWKSN